MGSQPFLQSLVQLNTASQQGSIPHVQANGPASYKSAYVTREKKWHLKAQRSPGEGAGSRGKAIGNNRTSSPWVLVGYGKVRLKLSLGRARESSVTPASLKSGLVYVFIYLILKPGTGEVGVGQDSGSGHTERILDWKQSRQSMQP